MDYGCGNDVAGVFPGWDHWALPGENWFNL